MANINNMGKGDPEAKKSRGLAPVRRWEMRAVTNPLEGMAVERAALHPSLVLTISLDQSSERR